MSPFPVDDLNAARRFYGDLLGCPEGRSDTHWIDFDLYGHQFVCHLRDQVAGSHEAPTHNLVDGERVPVPHYGVVLTMQDWRALADRLTSAGQVFIIEPTIRFAGEPGEQGTFFLQDPSGNALEFKGFENLETLFAQ